MTAISFNLAEMPRPKNADVGKKEPAATRLPSEYLRAVEELAAADRRTVSFIIEEAVREYVLKHAPEKVGASPASRKK